jgi:hypothetical protein
MGQLGGITARALTLPKLWGVLGFDEVGDLDLLEVSGPVFLSGLSTVGKAREPGGDFRLPFTRLVFPGPEVAWGEWRQAPAPSPGDILIPGAEPLSKGDELRLVEVQALAFMPGLAGPGPVPPPHDKIIHSVVVLEVFADSPKG